MTEVTRNVYYDDKDWFFSKHNKCWHVDTSPMTEDGVYMKTYVLEDDSCWYERMSPYTETTKVTIHGVEVEVEVKLQKVEYWSTDISKSRCYFEKW